MVTIKGDWPVDRLQRLSPVLEQLRSYGGVDFKIRQLSGRHVAQLERVMRKAGLPVAVNKWTEEELAVIFPVANGVAGIFDSSAVPVLQQRFAEMLLALQAHLVQNDLAGYRGLYLRKRTIQCQLDMVRNIFFEI